MAGLGFIVPRSRHSGDRLALSAHRNCWKITLGWIGVARVGFKCQQQLFLWSMLIILCRVRHPDAVLRNSAGGEPGEKIKRKGRRVGGSTIKRSMTATSSEARSQPPRAPNEHGIGVLFKFVKLLCNIPKIESKRTC